MTYAPPSAGTIAAAVETLQDTSLLTLLTPTQRRGLCDVAFAILRDAREARLGPRPVPQVSGTVHYLTTAEFRQGRLAHHRRPRLIVLPSDPTPGDAA